MRRGVWFLVIGVVLAGLGAATAYAAGTTTTSTTTGSTTTSTTSTTTTGTTTSPTTTGTTTTTHAPGYSKLVASYLSKGCVGAGAAAIAEPGRAVLALGTPASSLGPSAYPLSAPIVRFRSSAASGSACKTARVSLTSVSLFGGAVTARAVAAIHGRGTVSGFELYGSPVALRAGHPVRIGGWGEVTLEKTVGRLTAPLVVQLLAAHHSLPAGTMIAVAFGASQAAHTSSSSHAGSSKQSGHAKTKRQHKTKFSEPLTAVPSLSYTPSHYVFPVDGGASYVDTYGANRSDVSGGWHHGDDLFAPLGTPVVAVATGTLSLVGWNQIGGWRLWLTDGEGNSFYYAHLAGYSRRILKHHQVRAGQVLAFLGRTGDAFTTTPHLHFEIHPHEPAFMKLGYDGAVDPTTYLQKWRVEHLPAAEIPLPAELKAPVGTPRQEAAVVWHQLLVARHLSATGAPIGGAASSAQARFEHGLSLEASGVDPLVIGDVPSAAAVSSSQSDVPLLVGGPMGGLLAVAVAVGLFVFWRQHRTTGESAT
jgi:murein DD-endopeptidase MepM/ murein hydrolase activator NlpD